MTAHTKKHGIDGSDDHTGVTSATENGLIVYDSNGLPKNPSTDISVGQKLTGVTTPTADGDAANKGYVDSVAEGLDPKGSARVASTEDLTLVNEQTIDGVAAVAGDVVLAKDQTVDAENGLYTVVDAGAWTRTTDMPTGSSAGGAFSFITEGTVNGNRGYVCTNDKGADVVGTDDLVFTQFSGAGMITAGTGLTKTGDTINAIGGDGITANADDLAVDLHDTNPGLEIDTAQLRVKVDGAHGVVLGASGVELELESSKGLSVGASGLAIKPDVTTGATIAQLTLGANGVGVTVDNDTIGHTAGSIHVNSGGIILEADVTLAGNTPLRSDITGWANGSKGICIGNTDNSRWLVAKKDADSAYTVELSAFDPVA